MEKKWLSAGNNDYSDDISMLLDMYSLTQDEDIEQIFGIIDKGHLIAMAANSGKVLKQFAIHPDYRGNNLTAVLVAEMRKCLFQKGYSVCQVYTKPCNEFKFTSLGFKVLAVSDHAILLESGSEGIDKYLHGLKRVAEEKSVKNKTCGCIVMNANPFTNGHKYLVENALGKCKLLFIIVVEEDRSFFPYKVRKRLVEEGCREFKNIVVIGGGDYVISSATFPKYFIKKADEQAKNQAQLDIDLFIRYIAPALNISKRFVGEEPKDPLTEIYNRTMEEKLGNSNIEFIEIPRKKINDRIVSASSVRQALSEQNIEVIKEMVPETTFKYLFREELSRD